MQETLPRAEAPAPPTGGKRGQRVALGLVGLTVALVLVVLGYRRLRPEPAAASTPADVPAFDGNELVFSPRFAARAGLAAQPVQRGLLTPEVRVVGDVTFDPAYQAAVGARTRGFVKRVLKVEGDHVREGEPLAEVQSADLGQAQSDIAVASARRKAAEINAKREADLLSRRLTTAREAEEAEVELAAQKALLTSAQQRASSLGGGKGNPFGVYVMRSPISGTVVARKVDVGQSVDSETMAFRVANLDHLWIELAIFERSLGAVRVGDEVEVVPLNDSGKVIKGVVGHVGEVLDPATRSADVRVEVTNCMGRLRPGQSVQATIKASGRAREVLWVPSKAVTYVDGKPTIFVQVAEGRIKPTTVKLGESDHDRQELLEGVAEGQQVLVEGVFALKSELFR